MRHGYLDAALRLEEKFFAGLAVDGFAVIDGGLFEKFFRGDVIFFCVRLGFIADAYGVEAIGVYGGIGERSHLFEGFEIAAPEGVLGEFVGFIEFAAGERHVDHFIGVHHARGDLRDNLADQNLLELNRGRRGDRFGALLAREALERVHHF